MAKKEKKKKGGLMKEFKEFAIKGNMFDMAIGVLIGGIFKDLVTAFTNNIIMPVVSIFTGSIDFSKWKIALPSLFGAKIDPETGEEIINYLTLGDFVSAVISFLILAFVGGIENGTVPFPVGAVATGLMLLIEFVAVRAIVKRESEDESL